MWRALSSHRTPSLFRFRSLSSTRSVSLSILSFASSLFATNKPSSPIALKSSQSLAQILPFCNFVFLIFFFLKKEKQKKWIKRTPTVLSAHAKGDSRSVVAKRLDMGRRAKGSDLSHTLLPNGTVLQGEWERGELQKRFFFDEGFFLS